MWDYVIFVVDFDDDNSDDDGGGGVIWRHFERTREKMHARKLAIVNKTVHTHTYTLHALFPARQTGRYSVEFSKEQKQKKKLTTPK